MMQGIGSAYRVKVSILIIQILQIHPIDFYVVFREKLLGIIYAFFRVVHANDLIITFQVLLEDIDEVTSAGGCI